MKIYVLNFIHDAVENLLRDKIEKEKEKGNRYSVEIKELKKKLILKILVKLSKLNYYF